MIQINLLPEEYRRREKKSQPLPVLKIGAAAAGLFVLLTGIFYIDFLFTSVKLSKLRSAWEKIQPETLILNQLRSEVETVLKPEKDFIDRYVQTRWHLSRQMEWASEFLPDQAWLSEMKLERDDKGTHFLIRGLCLPSRDRSSIEQIEGYAQKLKDLLAGAELNLTTTRISVENIQLTQFVAVYTWPK